MPVCLQWDCWVNITGTMAYTPPSITGYVVAITPIGTTTTTSANTVSNDNTIQDLQNENFRLKLGLGLGLGGAVAATTGVAVGMFVYYSGQ